MGIYRGGATPGTGSKPTGDAADVLIDDVGNIITADKPG